MLVATLVVIVTQLGVSHAFSIDLKVTSDLVAISPTFPFHGIFSESVSCSPGPPCGSATSRYTVLGTALATIPAGFGYNYTDTIASAYTIAFEATGTNGRLLAGLRAAQFSDEGYVEAVSCGPLAGSCVGFIDSSGPLPPPDPRVTYVSRQEFESRGNGGSVAHGGGLVPFFLPVGANLPLRASLQASAGISFDT